MNNKYKNNYISNLNHNIQNNSNYNTITNLYRSNYPAKPEKKNLNFRQMKDNTICSLNEVEGFLNKLQHTIRYIKLFKLLK